MKTHLTHRGFRYGIFEDHYGAKCILQKSSLATEDAVWLGLDRIRPICMAAYAKELGVETTETTGWVDYPIPDKVFLNSRMHLNRDQARELGEKLLQFAETGELDYVE